MWVIENNCCLLEILDGLMGECMEHTHMATGQRNCKVPEAEGMIGCF